MPPNASFSSGSTATPETAAATTTTTTTTPGKKNKSKMKRLIKSTRRKKSGIGATVPKTVEREEQQSSHSNNDADPNNQQQPKHQQLQLNKEPPASAGPLPSSLEEISIRLQSEIEIRDRKYHLKTYPNCFVGSEVVDYLVVNNLAVSRSMAVLIAQEIMSTLDAFVHITRDHDFQDDYVFYQFKDDDPSATAETTAPNYHRIASTGSNSVDIKMDKYGFLIEDERCASERDGQDSDGGDLAPQRRPSDAKRWENILYNVPNSKSHNHSAANISYSTTQSKVKYYARRGLPDRLRRKAWTVLTGVDLIMNENAGMYDDLVENAEEEFRKMEEEESMADILNGQSESKNDGSFVSKTRKVLAQIERDIHRTFPKHYLFHTISGDDDYNENGSSEYGSSIYDSKNTVSDDESSLNGSGIGPDGSIGPDEIEEIAESTGQDTASVVEAKQQLFNESMNSMQMNRMMSGRGSIGSLPRIEGSQEDDDGTRASFGKASGNGDSAHSLGTYYDDEDNKDNHGRISDQGRMGNSLQNVAGVVSKRIDGIENDDDDYPRTSIHSSHHTSHSDAHSLGSYYDDDDIDEHTADGTGSARTFGSKNGDGDPRSSFQYKSSGGDSSAQSLGSYVGSEEDEDDDYHHRDNSARQSKSLSQLSEATGMGHGGMGHGQDSLRRVLRAYSMYDREVGYCQGMNFITAMFLTFLSEEEAFWLLVVVMNEEPYKLRELFGEDMAGTHEVLYIAEKLLAQFLPRLSKHFESETIHVSMFVTQWLMTGYTSTFPFDLVARVWDSFLVEGWKVVYRVMLSLLEHASKDIFELQFEQILAYFREFPKTVNGQVIMAGSLKIGLKRKHIQKHVNEWRRHVGGRGEEWTKRPSSRFHLHRRATDEGLASRNMSGSGSVSSRTMTSSRSFPKISFSNPINLLKNSPKDSGSERSAAYYNGSNNGSNNGSYS